MVNNGTLHYDHDMDGTLTQLAGCEGKFRNVDHDTIVAIRYENDILTVSTSFENDGKWKECFKVNGVLLPTNYYFGVSATTGDLSDNHDVIALRFFELEGAVDVSEGRESSQRFINSITSFLLISASLRCGQVSDHPTGTHVRATARAQGRQAQVVDVQCEDLLHDPLRHDCSGGVDHCRHHVLPEAQGELAKTILLIEGSAEQLQTEVRECKTKNYRLGLHGLMTV